MIVRLALEADKLELRELGKAHLAEIRPDLTWDDARAEATFERYLRGANPTIFVAETKRGVVGYVTGFIYDNAFTTGHIIYLDVIYVKPDMRGTRAAAELMIAFIDWTKLLDPSEVLISASNTKISHRTLRFFEKCGFEPHGRIFKRIAGV